MKKFFQFDLSKGTPWKVLLLFTLPILFGNFIGQIYSVFDGILIGHFINSNAFAAIGLAGSVTYFGTAIASGLPAGTSGYSAQLYGAKDAEGVRKSYAATLLIALVAGLAISLLMVALLDPLLAFAQIEKGSEVYSYARLYIFIIFIGLTGVFFYNSFLCFLRAIGDSFVPFWLLIIYAGLNIAFDALFIIVCQYGVMGAALAYDLSVALTSVIGFFWVYGKYPFLRLSPRDFHFPHHFLFQHIKMGLPMGALFGVIGLGVLMMQGAIDSYGTDCINGYSAASRMENFLCSFIGGFGSAMEAYTGQNYGAKKYKRIKQGFTQGLIILTIDAALKIIITWIVMDKACDLFLSEVNDATREYCRIYMYWDMVTYLFLGLIYLSRNVLLGLGNVWPPFISGVGEMVGRVVPAKVFTKYYGAPSALGGAGIAWVISGTLLTSWALKDVYFNPKFKADEEDSGANNATKPA
jgi:putative MATE family efflux protein